MKDKQWVQHVSGQGEKWEVDTEQDDQSGAWKVMAKGMGSYWIPKSEFRLTDPPEYWVDVTEGCEVACNNRDMKLTRIDIACTQLPIGYRLRKVRLYQTSGFDGENCEVAAFIIEKKVSG